MCVNIIPADNTLWLGIVMRICLSAMACIPWWKRYQPSLGPQCSAVHSLLVNLLWCIILWRWLSFPLIKPAVIDTWIDDSLRMSLSFGGDEFLMTAQISSGCYFVGSIALCFVPGVRMHQVKDLAPHVGVWWFFEWASLFRWEVLLNAREQGCREGRGLQGLHCFYEFRIRICSRNGTSFVGCIKIRNSENMEKVKDV